MKSAEQLVRDLKDRKPAHSLPREFYIDENLHALDMARIWHEQWIFVAHAVELPDPGNYVTVDIGFVKLLIIRGTDGAIRALHNVCRHRGSVLCDDARGSVRGRIVCPYHQWSYDLDGRLAKARKVEDDFDPNDHGLAVAACEVAGGMIFVSLSETPPDFRPVAAMFGDYLNPYGPENAKVAYQTTTVEQGNWKLVMENNRECFHCKSTHPELCATFPEAPLHSGGGSVEELASLERLVEQCEAIGLPSAYVASPDLQFRAMRMAFLGDARSMTADGSPAVAKRFADLPERNIGDVLLYHYPSTWNHYMADHAVTFRIVPIGPMLTQLVTTWLVPNDAIEGVDYDVEALTSVWKATNHQDTVLVERVQRGVMSPAYRPGPYSLIEEEGVIQFIDWYANQMITATRAES
jgi:phenylpropionate dioxygenase-like ring-hydroxylating dioxygenase large terminal subunit